MSLYDSSMGLMVVGTVLLVFSGFYLLLRQGTDMAHEIISLVFIAGVAIIMGGSLMMIFIKLKNKPDVTLPCILIHLSSLLLSFY
jgi:Na+/H+-translocating membrane pyrophosphatase